MLSNINIREFVPSYCLKESFSILRDVRFNAACTQLPSNPESGEASRLRLRSVCDCRDVGLRSRKLQEVFLRLSSFVFTKKNCVKVDDIKEKEVNVAGENGR